MNLHKDADHTNYGGWVCRLRVRDERWLRLEFPDGQHKSLADLESIYDHADSLRATVTRLLSPREQPASSHTDDGETLEGKDDSQA